MLNPNLNDIDPRLITKINGYTLVLTCAACPEQYDVYKNNRQVGYLRLRHGRFRADYPSCMEETVYEAYPNGDGAFEDDERHFYLTEAIKAIDVKRQSERQKRKDGK